MLVASTSTTTDCDLVDLDLKYTDIALVVGVDFNEENAIFVRNQLYSAII
jgi:hypothetical protein